MIKWQIIWKRGYFSNPFKKLCNIFLGCRRACQIRKLVMIWHHCWVWYFDKLVLDSVNIFSQHWQGIVKLFVALCIKFFKMVELFWKRKHVACDALRRENSNYFLTWICCHNGCKGWTLLPNDSPQCTMWLFFSKSSSEKIGSFAPILLRFDYFRQNIWRLFLAQFHVWYIFWD